MAGFWFCFGFVSVQNVSDKAKKEEPCERRRGKKDKKKRRHPGSFARKRDDVVIQMT